MSMSEIITVEGIGPYGVKSGSTWYKLAKNLKPDMFVRGFTYSVAVGTGKQGGKYINKIETVVGDLKAEASGAVLNPDTNKAPSAPAADNRPSRYGKPLSSYELAENRCIRRSGLIQASVQAVSAHVSKDTLASEAILLAEELLKWVEMKSA